MEVGLEGCLDLLMPLYMYPKTHTHTHTYTHIHTHLDLPISGSMSKKEHTDMVTS